MLVIIQDVESEIGSEEDIRLTSTDESEEERKPKKRKTEKKVGY